MPPTARQGDGMIELKSSGVYHRHPPAKTDRIAAPMRFPPSKRKLPLPTVAIFRWVSSLLAVVAVGPPAGPVRAMQTESQTSAFARQAVEIIRDHCWRCHGSELQKGELRLDSPDAIRQGGHTGNPLVAEDARESELLLRIQSPDPNYRMPAKGDLLTEDQISVLRKWIRIGAPFGDEFDASQRNDHVPGTVNGFQRALLWLDPAFQVVEGGYRWIRPVLLPLIVFCIVVLWIERRRRRRTALGRSSNWSAAFAWYLLGLLSIVGVAFWFYHREQVLANYRIIGQLRQKIAEIDRRNEPQVRRTPFGGPISIPPRHPRRLHGDYFRGNDERDPRLFNGGIYRTATLSLWLADSNQSPVDYQSRVAGDELYVVLDIRRAAQATPQLFTDRIIRSVYLSRQIALKPHPLLADDPVRLETLEPGEHWRARYPIQLDRSSEATSGVIYVYKASDTEDTQHGKFHYCIAYDIQLDGNRIGAQSQLWMGSLSTPSGLLIPQENQTLLNEWFGNLPIPEIEGTHTDDPALLGVPEYASPDNLPSKGQ